jgi:signal transduction histidine kinase
VSAEDQHALPASTRALLEAVTAISSDLELNAVLTRIVEAATQLTGARYGALGVLGSASFLVEFVTTGIGAEDRTAIGDAPHGHGILGLLIHHPEALRLADLTAHPQATGFPAHHPQMRTFLGVPVRIRGTVFGNLYLTEKEDGEEFTEQDQALVEALANAAGFVIENARAYGLSERRRQWLEASAVLSETLQPPIDLEDGLAEVTRSARSITGARATAVLHLEEGTAVHTVSADPDLADQVAAALVALEDRPWPRQDADPLDVEIAGFAATLVPLRTHLVSAGLLVILNGHGTPKIAAEERLLLASFADQAGLALDRAQAIEDRSELAVTSDRERIARDLHDVVIQRLFATGLQLQGAATIAGPEVSGRIDQAVEALDATIKDIRGTIFELQHADSGPSLRADLRQIAREYAPLLNFDPVVHTTGPIDTVVPREIRDQLLPVLREALSNLARHAGADHGEISVEADADQLRLTVLDDGHGIDPESVESGLRNARRRASSLGGSLELTPREPHGTSFVWRVPLR